MPNKITSWLKSHVTQYKIDFMSLNRLRLNQTVSGQIPVTISLTEKTRMAENLLWARSHDASTSFESMELLLNHHTAHCTLHVSHRHKMPFILHGCERFLCALALRFHDVHNQSRASCFRLMREHG